MLLAELSEAKEFIKIVRKDKSNNEILFYGGDQSWYKTRVGRMSGCGAVAAANIFAYLSLRNPVLSSLSGFDRYCITDEMFLTHMNNVIRFVYPVHVPVLDLPLSGLTSLSRFSGFCERYAASRDIHMKGYYFCQKDLDLAGALAIVREQLINDNPVALLNMRNSKLKSITYTDAFGSEIISDFQYHWVVITSLKKEAESHIISVSSEGARAELNFDDVWTNNANGIFSLRGIVFMNTLSI